MEEDLKSFARTLVTVMNALVAVAAGVYFVVDWMPREQPVEPLVAKGLLAVVGCGVVGVNALRLLYFRAGRRREADGPLSSYTEEGTVHVSREAVEAGLRAAGEALPEVTRLRVKVLTPSRRKSLVRAHYLAPEGVDILDLGARLRRVLRRRFLELVKVDKDGKPDVELVFEGFYGKPKPPPKPKAGEPAPEPEAREAAPAEGPPPFTGPRYPIDVEGEAQ